MSKFLYAYYRQSNQLQLNELLIKKVSKIFGGTDNNIEYFKDRSTHLLVKKLSPNTVITKELDYKIIFPSSNNSELYYLSIKHLVGFVTVKGDKLSSRIIWYYKDDEKFIVSSSQRAIVALIGNYEPNQVVWTWMLVNASLGPGFSWDKRINGLRAESELTFDIQKWQIEVSTKKWLFNYSIDEKQKLTDELSELFEKIKGDFDLAEVKTLLTLSGGYDSRAALHLLKHNKNLHTATWGVSSGFNTKLTDATIAQTVAKSWGIKHDLFDVELKNNFENNINKFLELGEGRNDHINSFMDGVSMWEQIEASGYKWVVRGDEVFGWLPVRTEKDVKTLLSVSDFSDYENNIPESVIKSLPPIQLPEYLLRQVNEPLEDYRDRLFQQYRIPFVITPLQDIPLSYAEILNPLLHPEIVDFTRKLPPQLRTNKKLYADLVDTFLPKIPYAEVSSIPEIRSIVGSIENKDFILNFLTDKSAINLLGEDLSSYLLKNFSSQSKTTTTINSPLKTKLIRFVPSGVKKFIRNKVTGYHLNNNDLVIRSYIIYKMQEMMNDAAKI